jgi:hypothetical protein
VRIHDDGTVEDVLVASDDDANAIASVRAAADELSTQLMSNVANMWGGDERPISKHAKTIKQV